MQMLRDALDEWEAAKQVFMHKGFAKGGKIIVGHVGWHQTLGFAMPYRKGMTGRPEK
jgi:hypothetical protein